MAAKVVKLGLIMECPAGKCPGLLFFGLFWRLQKLRESAMFFLKKYSKILESPGGGGKFTIVSKRHKITEAVKASVSCTKKTFSRKRLSIAHFQSGEQFMGKALLPLS
ncbi:hypothetical protein, partial [Phaeodactylibacter xiamenensis]|uniref:hypothetical protein n=1 Tax=Phaeodactylibacter xiamenensis TaxID=1524460 RepID=UPI0024A8591E